MPLLTSTLRFAGTISQLSSSLWTTMEFIAVLIQKLGMSYATDRIRLLRIILLKYWEPDGYWQLLFLFLEHHHWACFRNATMKCYPNLVVVEKDFFVEQSMNSTSLWKKQLNTRADLPSSTFWSVPLRKENHRNMIGLLAQSCKKKRLFPLRMLSFSTITKRLYGRINQSKIKGKINFSYIGNTSLNDFLYRV